jgi:hypothetical protein
MNSEFDCIIELRVGPGNPVCIEIVSHASVSSVSESIQKEIYSRFASSSLLVNSLIA